MFAFSSAAFAACGVAGYQAMLWSNPDDSGKGKSATDESAREIAARAKGLDSQIMARANKSRLGDMLKELEAQRNGTAGPTQGEDRYRAALDGKISKA